MRQLEQVRGLRRIADVLERYDRAIGRVDIFGMKNFAFPAPLTWQVPQLTPAYRATSPKIDGELKARLPSLIR